MDLRYSWTTVDKVVRILLGLGIITEKQRKDLRKSQVLLQHFSMQSEKNFGGGLGSSFASRKKLLILMPLTGSERRLILRSYRIYITVAGKEYAKSIEAKYTHAITRVKYMAEVERQDVKDPAAIAAMAVRYRKALQEKD